MIEADQTPKANLCGEIPCAEYRDKLECRVQELEARVRNLGNETKRLDGLAEQYAKEKDVALLQIDELRKAAEAARSKLHSLAVAAAMVRDGTGSMQPDGFYKLAHEGNEILGKVLYQSEKPKCEHRRWVKTAVDKSTCLDCKTVFPFVDPTDNRCQTCGGSGLRPGWDVIEKRKDDRAACGLEYTVGINDYSTCTRIEGHSGPCGWHTISGENYNDLGEETNKD